MEGRHATQTASKLQNEDIPLDDSRDTDLYPRFPPEIEHKIFVAAFDADPMQEMVGTFLLVSKRVYDWLIPLVFEIVITYGSSKWPPRGLPPEDLPRVGKYVRHLLLDFSEASTSSMYFTYCQNLTNLALVGWSSTGISALACLRPTELCVDLDVLPKIPTISPLCANVTHLDCAYHEWNHFIGPSESFSYFPNLTHLMVRSDPYQDQGEDVDQALRQFQKIKVFVLCQYRNNMEMKAVEPEHPHPDPRVVHLYLQFPLHWKTAAQGGISPWLFAEAVVEQRRNRRSDSDV
ncbi:hypothetical protein BDN72DRAFT_851199 [Pluteus cervinus]|uniref:Uncharacterized protein n=1 Tax=Pluteus cervinus TaxID=181527 RepID=A0ACD3A1Q1_9AGAR|nr:hypothetical protein BDN72DRAFT_851199 [Pluteus cervinus]